jgi:hypothetical protein
METETIVFEPEYTVDYYIQKFESIPDNQWTTSCFIDDSGKCCALGHCGDRDDIAIPFEAAMLIEFCGDYPITTINDGCDDYLEWVVKYNLSSLASPKERVLQFLKWVKNNPTLIYRIEENCDE